MRASSLNFPAQGGDEIWGRIGYGREKLMTGAASAAGDVDGLL